MVYAIFHNLKAQIIHNFCLLEIRKAYMQTNFKGMFSVSLHVKAEQPDVQNMVS